MPARNIKKTELFTLGLRFFACCRNKPYCRSEPMWQPGDRMSLLNPVQKHKSPMP